MKFVENQCKMVDIPLHLEYRINEDIIKSYLDKLAHTLGAKPKDMINLVKHLPVIMEVNSKVYNNIINIKYVVICEQSQVIPYDIVREIMRINTSIIETKGLFKPDRYFISAPMSVFVSIHKYMELFTEPLFAKDGIGLACDYVYNKLYCKFDTTAKVSNNGNITGIKFVTLSDISNLENEKVYKHAMLHNYKTMIVQMSTNTIKDIQASLPLGATFSLSKYYNNDSELEFIIPETIQERDKKQLLKYNKEDDKYFKDLSKCKILNSTRKWMIMCIKANNFYEHIRDNHILYNSPSEIVEDLVSPSVAQIAVITMDENAWNKFLMMYNERKKNPSKLFGDLSSKIISSYDPKKNNNGKAE